MDVWPVGRLPEGAKEHFTNQTKLHELCDGDSRTLKFCLQSKASGAPARLLLSFEEARRRYEPTILPASEETVATSPAPGRLRLHCSSNPGAEWQRQILTECAVSQQHA